MSLLCWGICLMFFFLFSVFFSLSVFSFSWFSVGHMNVFLKSILLYLQKFPFLFWWGSGTEVLAQSLHFLGRHSTIWAVSPTLFALVIFEIESPNYSWTSLEHDLPIYATCLARMISMYHHTQILLVKMGSLEPFAQAEILLISASQVARILSHCAWI
jgi:hypothetical protein